MCWRNICNFSLVTKNVKSRSKIALFSNERHFEIWFPKKRTITFFWGKLCKLHKKRPNFACGKYIFPKTRGNKNKTWTYSTPLNCWSQLSKPDPSLKYIKYKFPLFIWNYDWRYEVTLIFLPFSSWSTTLTKKVVCGHVNMRKACHSALGWSKAVHLCTYCSWRVTLYHC